MKILIPGAALAVAVGILSLGLTSFKEIWLFSLICIFFLLSGYLLGVGYGRKKKA